MSWSSAHRYRLVLRTANGSSVEPAAIIGLEALKPPTTSAGVYQVCRDGCHDILSGTGCHISDSLSVRTARDEWCVETRQGASKRYCPCVGNRRAAGVQMARATHRNCPIRLAG
jgi:hypothetical protein